MARIRFLHTFLLLLAVQLAVAQQYEYWMDNDYEQRKSVAGNVPEMLTMDISQLPTGLHYFNFRAKASNGQWGGLSRYMVYLSDNGAGSSSVTGCEYWLDNDYANRKQAAGSSVQEALTLDISHLSPGLHYFNFLAKMVSGQWGALSRYMVYLSDNGAGNASVTGYEYWLDKDYENRKVVTGSKVSEAITMDISDLSSGLHYFNFRAKTVSGQWGALSRYMIYLQNRNAVNAQVKKVEYWIDENEEQKLSQDVANDSVVITVDLKGLTAGKHTFNVHCQGENGEWSMPESYEFTLEEVDVPVALMPEVIYNGRFVRLSSREEGAAIYYTLDGTLPVEGQAILYDGEFDVDRLCLLRAVAVVDSLNPSDVAEYSIDYLYDGETAYVRQGNLLEKAFEWRGGLGAVERLTVEGPLSDADLALLKNAPALTHLDLGKTTLTSGRMPDGAFSGTHLVSFVSPDGFGSTGGQLFANCPRLAAVVWNADTALPANAFDGVDNPNLLLYVSHATYAPPSVTNVVVGGVAESIVLTDKDTGNNDFYCPQAFTATTVSYAHDFRMQTEIGVCRGWESIALPFTVQTITHERNGQLQPFMSDGDGKPFWLLQMSSAGLEPATEIKANQPYVIAMPNSTVYPDAYNQVGRVTFAARQAAIVPSKLNGVEGQGVVLVPALRRVAQSADVFAINRHAPYGSYAEGSVFVSDYREVRPFEAYTLHPVGGSRLIALSDLMGDSATGIVAIPIKEAADGTVSVYSLSGLLVATGQYDEVMKRLHKGVYIINGKKMVIK